MRRLMNYLASTGSALAVAGMGAFLAVGSVAAQAEPLKIAVIEPLSGAYQALGKAFDDGLRYGFEKINQAGGFNGEAVVVTEYDNASKPNLVLEKVKQAINDGNRIIISGIHLVLRRDDDR